MTVSATSAKAGTAASAPVRDMRSIARFFTQRRGLSILRPSSAFQIPAPSPRAGTRRPTLRKRSAGISARRRSGLCADGSLDRQGGIRLYDFGKSKISGQGVGGGFAGVPFSIRSDLSIHTLNLGVNYKF